MPVESGHARPAGPEAPWWSGLDPLVPTIEAHALILAKAEQAVPGARAVLLGIDQDTGRFRVLPGASIPAGFAEALERIGPSAALPGCPRAAALDQRQIAPDIAADPGWDALRDLAEANGIRACWSEPMHDVHGRVIGVMSLYFDRPRVPEEAELQQFVGMARLAAITESLRLAVQAEHDALAVDQAAVRVLSRFIGDGDLRGHAEEMVNELCTLTGSAHGILDTRHAALFEKLVLFQLRKSRLQPLAQLTGLRLDLAFGGTQIVFALNDRARIGAVGEIAFLAL